MTLIAACGDLHLGAGSEFGTAAYGPGSRLDDQRRAWVRACEIAVERQADAFLFAGDAAHHPKGRLDPAQEAAFREGLEILVAARIPTVLVSGNHDQVSSDRPCALQVFSMLPGVTVSRFPQLVDVGPLTIATLPWAPTARLLAGRDHIDADQINHEAAELLVDAARSLRLQAPTSKPCVLLGHWSVSGAVTSSGVETLTLREVVLPAHELEEIGFDYAVFGHIHRAQDIEPHGFGIYTGSMATVDWGEADQWHGVSLARISTNGSGEYDQIDVPDRPFVTLEMDPDAWIDRDPMSVMREIETVDGAVVRLRYRATPDQARRIDARQVRETLYALGAHRVTSIQPTIIREQRARAERMTTDLDATQALEVWLDTQGVDDALASAARIQHGHYTEAAR